MAFAAEFLRARFQERLPPPIYRAESRTQLEPRTPPPATPPPPTTGRFHVPPASEAAHTPNPKKRSVSTPASKFTPCETSDEETKPSTARSSTLTVKVVKGFLKGKKEDSGDGEYYEICNYKGMGR